MTVIRKFTKKSNILFLLCSCKNEVLVIDFDSDANIADLCLYESYASLKHKRSIIQKIRYIWSIIWNHSPYNDQIVLDKLQIKELSNFLKSIV